MAMPNWKNQTIFTGDNLGIMRGMNSESVDLIYLDPPFNSNADYAAPIGSKAAGAHFKDTWGLNDIDLEWHDLIKAKHHDLYMFLGAVKSIHGNSMMSYLIYMIPRMMEMHRILKPAGSIYVHIDPTTSHYWKIIMDKIFGKYQFRNEVIWYYKGSAITAAARVFPRKHDVILFYTKPEYYTFNSPRKNSLSDAMKERWGNKLDADNNIRWGAIKGESGQVKKHLARLTKLLGRPPKDNDIAWTANPSLVRSVWTDIPEIRNSTRYKESIGYPTQKPLALLRRIIEASSNEGDVVFDPFCGCATTLVAAEQLTRHWIGIDLGAKAVELVKDRLHNKIGVSAYGVVPRTDVPNRTDLEKIPKYNAAENKTALYGIQEGYCILCEEHFPARNLTIDHIVARSKGGTDHIDNLQLLCAVCNSEKGNRSQEEALARRKRKLNLKPTRAPR